MTILVVALYSKTIGKNVKHTAITDSSTIGAMLNLGVQLFEHHVIYSQSDITFPDKAIWLLQPVSYLMSMSSPCVSHSDVQALSWVLLIIKWWWAILFGNADRFWKWLCWMWLKQWPNHILGSIACNYTIPSMLRYYNIYYTLYTDKIWYLNTCIY